VLCKAADSLETTTSVHINYLERYQYTHSLTLLEYILSSVNSKRVYRFATMPPVQGTGKAPNIANPNMPTAANKTTSVNGSAAQAESATAVAQHDPAKAIEKLEIKTKASNANNIARVANSHLTSNDAKLHPLVSLRTGKPLDKFPETSKDIAKLTREFESRRDLQLYVADE
jgi:hypothetical protein